MQAETDHQDNQRNVLELLLTNRYHLILDVLIFATKATNNSCQNEFSSAYIEFQNIFPQLQSTHLTPVDWALLL